MQPTGSLRVGLRLLLQQGWNQLVSEHAEPHDVARSGLLRIMRRIPQHLCVKQCSDYRVGALRVVRDGVAVLQMQRHGRHRAVLVLYQVKQPTCEMV